VTSIMKVILYKSSHFLQYERSNSS